MPKRKRKDEDGVYQRDDSAIWWASFTDPSGRRIRRSTGQTDREAAKRIRAQWIAKEGKLRPGQTRIHTFDELMLAYLDTGRTLKGRCKSSSTKARDEGCVSALYDVWSGWALLPEGLTSVEMSGNAIDGQAVFDYVEIRRQSGATDSTIRRELSVLGAAITYANSRWGWRIQDPTMRRKPPQGEGRVRWITQEEAIRLIHVARKEPRAPHLADWIQAALFTGCRKEELLGLEWERVDLQKNTLYLEAHHNKSKRRQSVPLHPMAREAILSRARFRMEHCPGSPWVFCTRGGDRIKDIKRAFASACRRAGIVDFTPHDCRHTLASWLAMGGVPLAAIKDLLRHSSITVTERYAHLAPETARKGLDTLNVTFLSRSETLTNTDDVSA